MSEIIKLDYVTKIEGHAKLNVKIDNNKVKDVKLEIYEGARFFEDLVKGYEIKHVPIVTSRICGMCSCAHQIASCEALEDAYGIKASTQTKKLRKVLLDASIIQSHVMHLFFMVLPDYYGCSNAIELARDKKDVINTGIKVLSLSKKILEIIGGREVHSVTLRVGRVIAKPSQEEINKLYSELVSEFDDIYSKFVDIFSNLTHREFESDSNFIALDKNKIKTFEGEVYNLNHYISDINYKIKNYSSSKFIKLNNKNVITSPLSRLNLNYKKYQKRTKEFFKCLNVKLPSRNPFDNNCAQAIEIIDCFERCINTLGKLKIKDEKKKEFETDKDICGLSCIDVARGFLIHEYEIEKGVVKKCKIITPTTQNIQSIEDDIKKLLPEILDKSREEITMFIESLIRAYDPCISCSTHFLKVNWEVGK